MTLFAGAAHAAAGQVLFALGRVEIQRGGQTFVAQRGVPVEVGDTISTGPTGMAQVRLQDGALLSLRYGSTMQVEDFRMPEPAPTPAVAAPAATSAPVAPAGGGRSVLRLVRGAFRTVTGLIGKGAGDTYRVVTPVATIGIRGTDYSAAYCSGDCGATADGLYVGVSSGEIQLDNDAGQLVLGNDQYGRVRDATTPPERELAPPEALETPIESSGEEEAEGEGGEGEALAGGGADDSFRQASGTGGAFEIGGGQPEGDYELRPGAGGSFAFAKSGETGPGNNGVHADQRGALVAFLTDSFNTIGTAQNTNLGSDPGTGLRWGRWTGGSANLGGSAFDLSSSSLHWIYAAQSAAPVIPIEGSLNYSIVGNTNPTDGSGNVGFLGSASFSVCFNCGTVSSSLNLGINNQVWEASGGSGNIFNGNLFAGSYGSVTVDGNGTGASGEFSGFFTNNAAGAGLGYTLLSPDTTVSGAVAFGNPTAPPVLITEPSSIGGGP